MAVAEEKSITKAAARLRIAQPAVSRQIAWLEQELGTPLCVRLACGIELTDAGEFFLEPCYSVYSNLPQGYRDITALSAMARVIGAFRSANGRDHRGGEDHRHQPHRLNQHRESHDADRQDDQHPPPDLKARALAPQGRHRDEQAEHCEDDAKPSAAGIMPGPIRVTLPVA